MFTAGLLTFLGFAVLFYKLGFGTLRKVLAFDLYIDIIVTATMVILLSGSFAGMMAAISGGLIFSLALSFTKHYITGYETLVKNACKSCGRGHLEWVQTERSRIPILENTYTHLLACTAKLRS